MQMIERLPQVEGKPTFLWQQYLIDTLLACIGTAGITGVLYAFHLYPTIPDIAIAYLLVILPLAVFRGRYAAILTSILASLSFDFFLVPPLYMFTIYRGEEWIALGIFLLIALVTSYLAGVARQQAQLAFQRERETRILYEMIRLTNSQGRLEDLLEVIALSIVRVFAPWGVRSCALLLPDAQGKLTVQADAPLQVEMFALSPDEVERASWVMLHGSMMESREAAPVAQPTVLSLLPLKAGKQVLGVLALRLQDAVPWFAGIERTGEDRRPLDRRVAFFWTFLEQASSVIEREKLRTNSLMQK